MSSCPLYRFLIYSSTSIPCPHKPFLRITNEKAEGLVDVSGRVKKNERAFYMRKPMEIILSCTAKKPIQVEVEGEMPSLVADVYYSRELQDFFDPATYCYSIVFKLPADLRVTGTYVCSDIPKKQHSSSLLIFSNGLFGSSLLSNGTKSKYTKGTPDDDGWIRIPCVSTNPFLIPKIARVNHLRNSLAVLPVAVEDGAMVYDPGRGFRINARSPHCCSKEYLCELEVNPEIDVNVYSSTSIILYKTEALGGKVFSRVTPTDYVLGFNPETETEIRVRISEPIRITCESNARIHLETNLQSDQLRAFFAENPNSFYQYRANLLGSIDKVGVVTSTCKEDKTQREIHKWKITILSETEFTPAPGIHIFNKKHYPITCYSANGKTPTIFIIQCDDAINCHTAEEFSHLVLKHQSETVGRDEYPFGLIPGHRSCVRERDSSPVGCAQMSTLGSKRWIVKCIETNGEDKYIVYTENFVLGLNNTIIKLPKDPKAEAGKAAPRQALIGMEPINDTVYVDEEIRIRCNASYGVFAVGIQIMLQLRTGANLTIGDFATLQSQENLENQIVTYEGKLKIENAEIERIWCFAPIWNSEGWRSVSEEVRIVEGQRPQIRDGAQNLTLHFGHGETGHTLSCNVSGDPLPEVTWFKDNDTLSEKNTKVIKIEKRGDLSVLHLAPIVEAHEGVYSCEAENVKGKSSKHFSIQVSGKIGIQNLFLYLGLAGAFLLIAGIVICILIKLLRNRSDAIERLTELEIHEFEFGNQNLAKKFAELNENARYLPYKQDFEIPKDKLEFKDDEVLGAGAFGLVLKGYFTRHSERFPVAIKTVRSNVDISHLRNLLSEIKILMYIGNHPNIIGLYGAITRDLREGKLHVVVEYCGNGNLLSFLRECRPSFINQITSSGKIDFTKVTSKNQKSARLSTKSWKLDDFLPEPRSPKDQRRRSSSPIKTWDLINWALQIAHGMEYLGTKKVIHGDLATRNLLLTDNLVVKITDFGLSSHLYDYTNYIKKQKEEPVPWRWLSVEAIRDSKFSIETDIWAYGITLWEIFSLAEVPYQGFSWGREFVDQLYAGLRLPSPPYANPYIYAEMEKCWATDPSDRSPFSHLQKVFSDLLKLT